MHMDNQKSDNEAIGNEEASEERVVGLRPLAPVLLSREEMAAYEDEFEFAFKEDRIRNIALSGPYGAGKNTVMESWEALHPELSFIHVELAHFEEPDGNDLGDGKAGRNLEAEILNQLIHKIDASKTPKSRFKRTADRDAKADWKAAVAIVAFVVISAVLAWVLNAYTFVEFLALPIPALVLYAAMGAAWLALAVYGVKHLMKTSFLSKTMKKLKFVNAEVEVADRGDDSAFNRLMDDLLYLLNGSECSAIVFEDLDRFKNIGIFEKLRTINSLANQSRPAGSRLKFVYLVHDGLFSDSHDRTKFFDYIIPVIPYVDTSNSFDILKSGLQGIGVSVDDRFMRGLSVFIDDPRILNAIVDEAFHYSRALGSGLRPGNAEDAKRLVGAIAYKETFPRDYESLQVGRGYLYTLLNSRARLQERESGRINADIAKIEAQVDQIRNQESYDEDEIAILFLNYRIGDLSRAKGPYQTVDLGQYKTPQDLITAINGDAKLKGVFDSLKATLEGNAEYESRLASSNQKREQEISRLQGLIDELETEIVELDRKPLSELYVRKEDFVLGPNELIRPKDYEDLHFEQVKDSPYFGLIPYLIKSGAIDESYQRYTSNFYPYSLTARDRDFVTLALQGISEADPAWEIDSPDTVLEHLDESSLGRRQARNFALLKRLLENNRRNELDALFRGVEADRDLEYLVGYSASRHYTRLLFPYLSDAESPLVAEALHKFDPVGNKAMRAFCHRIASDGGSFLEDPQIANALKEKSSADPDFLMPGPADPEAVAKGLEAIGFRSRQIDFGGIDSSLADEAFNRRLFEPNIENVAGFLLHYGASQESVEASMLPNTVCKAEESPHPEVLKRFVEENPSTFIASLTASVTEPIRADEGTVAWLLNAEPTDEESAKSFANVLDGSPVKNLSAISRREMKSALMSCNRVIASAENILDYYSASGSAFDDTLTEFVNENEPTTALNAALADELIGEQNSFLEDLIRSDVSIEKLKKTVSTYGTAYASFGMEGLPEDKVKALIDIGTIEMTGANLEFIRRHYRSSSPLFAIANIDDYCKLVIDTEGREAEVAFDEDEVTEIFAEPNVAADYKVRLLTGFSTSVELDQDYPEELLVAICETRLWDEDLPVLPAFYHEGGAPLKQAIAEAASSHYRELMIGGVDMPWDMAEHVLRNMAENGDVTGTTMLVSWMLGRTGENVPPRQTLQRCFGAASLDWYVRLLEGTWVTVQVPNTKEDMAILKRLVEFNMCSEIIGGPNDKGFIEAHPKGHSRKKERDS